METATDQEIKKRFAELPSDIRMAIESNDAGRHIQDVGNKYMLHVDQLGALKDATYLIMLGFADPDEFADNITKMCNVPQEVAQKIAQELSEQLFVPIRESMQKFMDERQQKESPAAAPLTPTSSQTQKMTPYAPVEDMLAVATVSSSKMIAVAPSAPPTIQPQQKKGYPVDPYREPVE